MKKSLNISLVYAIAALIGGVFYREFTKMNNFTDVTMLGKVHTHLFMLGMFVFLISALFCAQFKKLPESKLFKVYLCIYNIGVPFTTIMMVVRGIIEVRGIELSRGANGAISGIAGIAHILVGVGIVLFILSLKSVAKKKQ